MKRKVKAYAGFILLCLLAGLGSWYLVGDISGQYRELLLPPLSPPAIVFPHCVDDTVCPYGYRGRNGV